MSVGRILGAVSSTAAVAGCAALVIAMSTGQAPASKPTPHTPPTAAAELPGPAERIGGLTSTSSLPPALTSTAPALVPSRTGHAAMPASPTKVSAPGAAAGAHATTPSHVTVHPPGPVRVPAPPAVRGGSLPVGGSTSGATEVITVVAPSYSSHTATLQDWRRAPGGGWLKVGSAVLAHVGADGLSTAPSESKSATPIGSFTLTQAFGYYANPGTSLSYFQTTPSDYWISDAGRLYNTHQRCSNCGYNDGVNERLYYETPFYNYAVVIDYNTPNSPTGVRQGAGSAFFLHVTDGNATAGCVSVPQANLVSIMRWLNPADHPRILIGVA